MKSTQLVTLISRDEKINASAVWGPWGLGALGPGPPGPLDKTALISTRSFSIHWKSLTCLIADTLLPKTRQIAQWVAQDSETVTSIEDILSLAENVRWRVTIGLDTAWHVSMFKQGFSAIEMYLNNFVKIYRGSSLSLVPGPKSRGQMLPCPLRLFR